MRVAIVSACFGRYDVPHPQVEQDAEIDWYYITDRPDDFVPPPWVLLSRSFDFGGYDEHPRLAAKTFKMAPWEFFPGYDRIIWVDASMEVTSPTFVAEVLDCLGDRVVATWRHPRRKSVYAEVEASLVEAPEKYEPIAAAQAEQAAGYRSEGYRDSVPLAACGTLAWNLDRDETRPLGEAWLAEVARTTIQDQVSFPVVCWRAGVMPAYFPVRQIEGHSPPCLVNRWMKLWPHERND